MELNVKSTRSELKENLLAHYLDRTILWVKGNLQIIVGALIILVVGGLMSSVFIIRRNEARDKNWVRMAQAEALFKQNDSVNARKILSDIIQLSPGTNEALFASHYMGEIALAEKKFDEAVALYSDVVAKSGKSPLKPLALSNLAFSYSEKKDFQAAAQTYKQFMNSYAEHFMAARNQLAWGTVLLKTGETEAAKETLGQLIDLYPTSPWAENARQIMDKLTTR
jgi:TolA-binding protein